MFLAFSIEPDLLNDGILDTQVPIVGIYWDALASCHA